MTCDFESMMLDGFPVKCSTCGGSFHTLTRDFRPVPPMRGSYLRMKPRYRGNGWYAFPEYDWVVGDNVQCPQCGMPYKMSSILKQVEAHVEKLRVRNPWEQETPLPASEECAAPAQEDLPGDEGAAPEDLESGGDGGDDTGLYDNSFGGDDLISRVMRLTSAGETQARIAETCQISIYMVRQIQNGRKV